MKMRLLFISLISCTTCLSQQLIVTPYIQPGNAPTLNKEEKVIIWQTDSIPASFTVEYGSSRRYNKSALVKATMLNFGNSYPLIYRAILPDLSFDEEYYYRVSMNGRPVAESSFTTRSAKFSSRFVVFGDCGIGTAAEAQIAYRAYLSKPQFVLITGDNVYSRGRVSEYLKYYFPYFNNTGSSPQTGAPLMRSVPIYLAVGNHDVYAADLGTYPDGLGYFYYFDLPLNAPAFQRMVTAKGRPEQLDSFRKATEGRYPNMANYSFDHGNVHIACIDSNPYVHPFETDFLTWLENDLKNSKAKWKIVAFHHPGFHSSNAHYNAQWMRVLSPVFERSAVDLVLNGHVHNYQRSYPLKFNPKLNAAGKALIDSTGRVDGKFILDKYFDGKRRMKPDGVVYIVTGAGGAGLYDTAFSNKPNLWAHEPEANWVPFTVKLISHVYSYSLIETSTDQLIFQQLDVEGRLLDRIRIKK
ncbi:MAG: metallophosphoesterase [Chitinophagaceae bacterium]